MDPSIAKQRAQTEMNGARDTFRFVHGLIFGLEEMTGIDRGEITWLMADDLPGLMIVSWQDSPRQWAKHLVEGRSIFTTEWGHDDDGPQLDLTKNAAGIRCGYMTDEPEQLIVLPWILKLTEKS